MADFGIQVGYNRAMYLLLQSKLLGFDEQCWLAFRPVYARRKASSKFVPTVTNVTLSFTVLNQSGIQFNEICLVRKNRFQF